jgi:hypothetical protein
MTFVTSAFMLVRREPEVESMGYNYAKLGFFMLTLGMLLGYPWALKAWGPELVVGSEDLQFDHDVGHLQHLSPYPAVRQQTVHVVFFLNSRHSLFSGHDLYLCFLVLFSRGAYLCVEDDPYMSLQQLPTEKKTAGRAGSLDFLLILATVGVLFAVSVICVYGMFYFKLASLEQLPPQEKMVFMNTMNRGIAPFIIGLILLLGICVPKRLLSVSPARLVCTCPERCGRGACRMEGNHAHPDGSACGIFAAAAGGSRDGRCRQPAAQFCQKRLLGAGGLFAGPPRPDPVCP